MALILKPVDEQFIEASNNWNLEKLYIELASAKGKGLTPVEKRILRGLLCGYSPSEIADVVYKSRSSSVVRVYLSNGLYKYIESMLFERTGKTIKINHWSRVTNLLEKVGYKVDSTAQSSISDIVAKLEYQPANLVVSSPQELDWGEAIDVSFFYGRQAELAQLEQWILTDRCRLVALLGMGGIGKTAVAVKLAQQIQNKFDYLIWRSLSHGPPVQDLLADLIEFLSQGRQPDTTLAETVSGRILQLIGCLRASRCLIVLDGVESLLQPGSSTVSYREDYEGYSELFKRIGEVLHQSCLVVTSREKLREIAPLEGSILPVRCLQINDLKPLECQNILQEKGLFGKDSDINILIKYYAGNPLILKLVATTIHELFDGNISEFIKQDILAFGRVRELLEQHFNRLSAIERKVMYWLATHRELVLFSNSAEERVPSVSKNELLEALESLRWRSLIDKQSRVFKSKFIFMRYITEARMHAGHEEKVLDAVPGKLISSTETDDG